MKKTIYPLVLFIIAGILLTSCSTQLSTVSIKKRHYRSGYYVDIANSKKNNESVIQEQQPIDTKQITNKITDNKTIAETTTPATILETTPAQKNEKTIPKDLTASAVKHTPTQTGKIKLKHITSSEELKNIAERAQYLSDINKGNNNNGGLIWTIIVILLVLWLLALLTGGWGLGGLIYLLLVIALILLILKLLGVI
ncbi:MAG TPA: lmo0937 family membrane protein [Bacteroidia bacterium]|nr:lmo0937 family membrane protein [Bacteroidia bacterium]